MTIEEIFTGESDNLEFKEDETKETDPATDATKETDLATVSETMMSDEEKVLKLLKEKANITQKELSEVTNISLGTVKRLLPKLQKEGKLERVGNRRSGYWKVLI